MCDDARDILDELQERRGRLLDPRQAPWTIQVKSANSASTSIQLLVERGGIRRGRMQEESPKRLGKEKGGDSARQRLGLTAQYHSRRDPETSSSSFPSTDSPGEAAIMTSPPHHTGRFIDAVPSDQLQIVGEPAESTVNAENTNVHQQQDNAIQQTANVVYTHDPEQIERLIQAHVAAALSEQRQQSQGEAMQMAFSAKEAEREKQQTQVQAEVGVARIHQEAIQKRDQQIAELMGQLEQAKGQIEQLNTIVYGSQSACAVVSVPPGLQQVPEPPRIPSGFPAPLWNDMTPGPASGGHNGADAAPRQVQRGTDTLPAGATKRPGPRKGLSRSGPQSPKMTLRQAHPKILPKKLKRKWLGDHLVTLPQPGTSPGATTMSSKVQCTSIRTLR